MSAPRYGMVVDLNRCVGCQTCTIACKHANDTPPGVQWRRVLDVEQGVYPDVQRLFLVTGCQHCAEPPCVPVCPTGATRQRSDGLVTMDYDTCIGCGYCAVACPYQARTIVHDRSWYFGGAPTRQEIQTAHDERLGVANKCTFCVERIDEAKERGLTPGVDLAYTPACAASCIAQAIHFGDFADPESGVSRLAEEHESFQMHADLGTDPQIRYLYEIPDTTPGRSGEQDPAGVSDADLSAGPLVGRRQTFWDARAAMNFTFGGMASGLIVAAFVAWLAGLLPERSALSAAFVAGAVFMAFGLFCVFLEIGRKLRFLHALRRPGSSWMTREIYAAALLYPAILADVFLGGAALPVLVAAAAAAFLYCQARILHAAKGIPSWRVPLIPPMLVASGLLEGCALLAAGAAIGGLAAAVAPLAGAVVLLAAGNAALWYLYRARAVDYGIGALARRDLASASPFVVGLGHAAPIVLCLASLAVDPPAAAWLAAAGGISAFLGGVLWKFAVITRACHEQGFALPAVPQRGSGARAAPPRLTPRLGKPESAGMATPTGVEPVSSA